MKFGPGWVPWTHGLGPGPRRSPPRTPPPHRAWAQGLAHQPMGPWARPMISLLSYHVLYSYMHLDFSEKIALLLLWERFFF